jgi:subtilase family serine protease
MALRVRAAGRIVAAAALMVTSFAVPAQAVAATGALAVPLHGTPVLTTGVGAAPPTDAACEARFGIHCYTPQQVRHAYGVDALIDRGDAGRGQTIVIIDSYGSPTVAADLARFDQDYGLPAPPSLQQLAPLGSVPWNPSLYPDQIGWAEETSLDVQWSHAMAPEASIVVLTSPVDETEGVQGLPQFLELEKYAVEHHLGNVISQSWAATENTLFTSAGKRLMAQYDNFYRSATLRGVTFLGSTGDSGTANPDVAGNTYPFPTVNFPAASPWVTAVGGTSLYLNADGSYQRETVWNDGIGATGGGVSQYLREPLYQRLLPAADQRLLGGHRGIPDVAFNADPDTGVPVFLGFINGGLYGIFGGTSEGSPSWAGIVADLDQLAGVPLGFLNPALYALGASGNLYGSVLHDVTVGNNGFGGVSGYQAGPGWDAATGWGTPNLAGLARFALARLAAG